MSDHSRGPELEGERVFLPDRWRSLGLYLVGGGAALLLVGGLASVLTGDGLGRYIQGYLVSYAFFLSLSLGALFFVAIQHVTGSVWSVVVRRVAELLSGNLVVLAVLLVPVIIGGRHIYSWMDPAAVAGDHLLEHKQPYLNVPFFVLRCVVYFAVWMYFARGFLRRSLAQDSAADPEATRWLSSRSAPALVVLGLTVTFAAFDLLMAIDPHWYSTIFGVYFFAGSMVAVLATLVVASRFFQGIGLLGRTVTVEHYHDLGKLLFAFVFFWGYIAFSQYLLIWYADIPEETVWYLYRQHGGWGVVAIVLLFGHFVVPFLGLMSRRAKRRIPVLVFWALFLLVMHWIDLYWIIMPQFAVGGAGGVVLDIVAFAGLGAVFDGVFLIRAGGISLVPRGDPRLEASLSFKNV